MTWPSTTIKATAAAGGCKQHNINIPKIDRLAAKSIANKGSPSKWIVAITTKADKVLPAITAQGWAIGLPGKANTSNALAPQGRHKPLIKSTKLTKELGSSEY